MSTYTVTSTPSQVLLGSQDEVALVNLGPSTIYLEGDTAVSVLNGIALPPMGQMTWNTRQPMWAVCASGGTALLQINNTAGRVDANRAKFWSLIRTVPNPPNATEYLQEVGHCETVLIKLTTNVQASPTVNPTFNRLLFRWFDAQSNLIECDSANVAQLAVGSGDGFILVRLPVIGTFLGLTLSATTNEPTNRKMEVFGTNRVLSYKTYCTNVNQTAPILYYQSTTGPSEESGDNFAFTARTNFSERFFFGSLGKIIHIEYKIFQCSAAGGFAIRQLTDDSTVAISPNVPIAAATTQYTQIESVVPQKEVLYSIGILAIAGTNFDVAVSWRD